MSTTTLHGQMSVVDDNGNVTILHQETSASDVIVDSTSNTQGESGASAIPSDIDSLQKLTDNIGSMAFKSEVGASDFADELDLISVSELEDGDAIVPESEINDNIVSENSTWSSRKLDTSITEINTRIDKLDNSHNLYIPLVENGDGSYTAQKTVAEIEIAYQNGKAIWVFANDIFLPLRQRIDGNNWVFSGYADNQAYDVNINDDIVTVVYHPVATTNDMEISETATWSSKKIDNTIKSAIATTITYGTDDLVAGESELPEGTIYFVYE